MNTENFSWDEFHHSVILNTSTDKLFELVTTADGLEKWFLGNVNFIRNTDPLAKSEQVDKNDKYQWYWQTKKFSTDGTVLDLTDSSVVYSFGDPFTIEFQVENFDGRSRLNLHQRNKNASEDNKFAYLNCAVCWVFFLTNLKSVVEHNVDLRETEVLDEALINQ